MKQLTGADTSFLTMETPTVFGHIAILCIYKKPHPGFVPIEAVYERYSALVSHIEPLHRRLVEVPFELDLPYWTIDPDVDLEFHIRELNLPEPGRVDQLTAQVARIVARPMDRTRPLWEVYVIGGLEDDQWALLTMYHHAAIDGSSGARLLSILNDTSEEPPPLPEPQALQAEPVPDGTELLRTAMVNAQVNPYKAIQAQVNIAQRIAEAFAATDIPDVTGDSARQLLGQTDGQPMSIPPVPVSAPPTPWNRAITPHRRLAIRSTSLENIKRLKNATDTTVNDVVLAICAGALRKYLLAHNALPAEPLRAVVPVSIRTGNEADPWTNRVGAVHVDLPTNEKDPLVRLALCHEAMTAAKKQFKMVPAEGLMDLARYSAPVLAASANRLASQLRLADQYSQPYNLIISNVPGPRQPLYFAGAPMQHQFPASLVSDGQGLNITVHSYLDKLDFGMVSDRDLVPDLWDLADMHIDEIAILFQATGAKWASPPDEPAERRGPLSHMATRRPVVVAVENGQSQQAPRAASTRTKRTKPTKKVATKLTKKPASKTAGKSASTRSGAKATNSSNRAGSPSTRKAAPNAKNTTTPVSTTRRGSPTAPVEAANTSARQTDAAKTRAAGPDELA